MYFEVFKGKFASHATNGHIAVAGSERFVNNQDVAFFNAGITQRVPGYPGVKSAFGMFNQVFIQVDTFAGDGKPALTPSSAKGRLSGAPICTG